MVNVRFYGSLKQFGSEFNLDCKTPAEVVHALTSQIPKLRQPRLRAGTQAAGIGLRAGGVAQMRTKMPTMRGVTQTGAVNPASTKSKQEEEEKKQSTSFSNLSNMVAQGKSMPLAYGLIRTGTLVISQGVETMDVDREPAITDEPNGLKLKSGNFIPKIGE